MSTPSTRSSLDVLASTRPKFPEGLLVLLVESSTDQHSRQLLTDLQYSVTQVKDVSDAISALHHTSADVILADISLVGDLTSRDAKALFTAAGKVPVLLMGVNCSSSQVLAAVEHGAADFMEKPLSQPKLRNIWQHTVRMMMQTGLSKRQLSSPTAAEAAADLMAKHDAAADAAAAAAAVAFAPSTAEGSLGQPAEQLGQPPAFLQPCLDDDCFKALELPPLMESRLNMDPEMIFLDLGTSVQPGEPSLDDILQPFTPSDSAAGEELSTDQMVTNCSSEQHGSGTTGMTAFPGELESCADTSSRMGGNVASPLGSRVAGLRTQASMRSVPAPGDWQQLAVQPAPAARAHSFQHQRPVPATGCPVYPPTPFGSWASSWTAPAGVTGMVWGMPVYNVARAPGLIVPKSGNRNEDSAAGVGTSAGSTSASAASSPTHKGNTAATTINPAASGHFFPWLMPQMCWPMMPMMGMPPAASGSAPVGNQMQLFPRMFPGMFPGVMPPMMGSVGMQMMGMPGVPPMGLPGMWPATTTAPAPAVPTHQQQPAYAPYVAARMAPMKAGSADTPAAAPVHDVSTNSEDATGTAAVGVWRAGSVDSGGLAAGDEFVSGLFVEEPRLPAGCMEHLNTDTLFNNIC